MSVHGEFERIAADTISFLETTEGETAHHLAAGLRSATEQREDDICRAASQVLELLSEGERHSFHSELEHSEFDRQEDHLASICRAVLGSVA